MHKYNTHKRKRVARGFTLVELLVSVFLFSVVMTISLGTLIVLIDANQKAQGVQAVMSNLSFSLDSMTRNIRTARGYFCDDGTGLFENFPTKGETRDCSTGNFIVFTDGRTGDQTGYRLNDEDYDGAIERMTESGGVWLRITSPELVVTTFHVEVAGSGQYTELVGGDGLQPTADIIVQGYIVSDDDTDTDFTLQTNVTQRTIDF